MSYNGSGTFQINTSGQPVVAGTVISSTAFNALTADLATGLSTAITKDGQTTATARIPFAAGISSTLVTDSSSTTTGSIITAGGVGIAKALYVGTTANVASTTDSSSISTGAIVTAGGAGIAKNLYVGGTLNVTGSTTLTNPVINNIKMGYSTTATAAGTTTLTVSSNYRQFFTGSTTQTVVLPVTSTLVTGMAFEIENNSTGLLTVNSSGGNLVGTIPAGVCAHAVCIGTTLTTAADWDWDYISTTTITGTGANVLGTSPTITSATLVTPALGTPASGSLVNCTDLNYTGLKNRIINGAMVIDQRNAGASITPTNGQFSVDRWSCLASVASKYTAQQNASSVTLPAGFIKYLGITSSSAYSVLTGDYFNIRQGIEGLNVADLAWGTASAATVTLSFWVRSSLTGTFGGGIVNGVGDRSYPYTYTISTANTWEQKTITIAGDTTGTWATTNSNWGYIQFGLGVGTTYSGTAGAWAAGNYLSATGATSVVGTNGATFYITGVQLEKGSTATTFDYRPYGTELQLCQRYYYLMASGNTLALGIGTYTNSSTFFTYASFPVSMRTAPNLVSTTGTSYYTTDAGDLFNSFTIAKAHTNGAAIYNNTEMSGTALSSNPVYTNNASASIAFNSEL